MTQLASLRTSLEIRLPPEARAWLHDALEDAADGVPPRADGVPPAVGGTPACHRTHWERHFAEAGRRCRAAHAQVPPEPAAQSPASPDPDAHSPAEQARVLLLHAAAPDAAVVARLYRQGTTPERRAVLLALPSLPLRDGPDAVPLLHDALRTNDPRLVAAALGPYAVHLDGHAWRHAVLKCLFTGVPLAVVHGLDKRAEGDAELARMLGDFARERTAAGRPVPEDLTRTLTLTGAPARPPGQPARPPGQPAGPKRPQEEPQRAQEEPQRAQTEPQRAQAEPNQQPAGPSRQEA